MIDDFLPSGGKRSALSPRKPKLVLPPADAQPNTSDATLLDEPLSDVAPTPQIATEPQQVTQASDESTPDETSELDPTDLGESDTPDGPEKAPKTKRRFHWPFNRYQTIATVLLVLCLPSGIAAAMLNRPSVKSGLYTSHRPAKPAPKITTVASTLTGLQVDPSVNKRPVTAVMIENSLDARPQSGLDQAGVVFEALAEGGVTRFMAVFQDTQPDYLGPVRSARPYYVQWAFGFDAGYAHVGGSPQGLSDIKSWGVRDLDQFANSGAYHRVSSRDAPHNVYTSIAELNQLEQNKGYTSSNYTGFDRKKDAPSKTPNATSIDMKFSGQYYNAHFEYDAATNSYKRFENGAAHTVVDKSGAQKQITPKVVIGMVVPMTQGALDASGAYYSDYNPIGSGGAYVFQDGIMTKGSWSKAANNGSLSFVDANGQPLKLNPGQTWISAVTADASVSYK